MAEWLKSTMLIERLIGVIAYCFVVLVGFNYIKRKKVVFGLNLCLVFLVILAFFYIPGNEADLSRIREMSANWGSYSFGEFLSENVSDSSVPVALILYYVVAKIGVIGILPAFCAFVFFVNAFHIFKKISQNKGVNYTSVAVSFLVFMSSGAFLEVISGVRCFMAFSIVMRFAFDEVYKNKTCFLHLPFYLLASLIHPAALVLTLIWLTYSLFRSKRMSTLKFIFNILVVGAALAIILYAGKNYVDEMFSLANMFLNNDVYSYFWEYVIGVLQIALYIYILAKISKKGKKDFIWFSIILLCLIIGLCFEYNIFHRFITALSFFMIPITVVSDNELYVYKNGLYLYKYYAKPSLKLNFVCYFALIILMVACARGNLCGYKFLLLG